MKKNKILLVVLVLFMAFMSRVSAAEDKTCNAVSYNELRNLAANVKISYEEATEEAYYMDGYSDEETPTLKSLLYIKIYNMNSRLHITYDVSGDGINNSSSDNKVLTLDDVGQDGAITLRQEALPTMATYTFHIASDSYGCGNKILRNVKITLPRFNYYSRLSKCKEIPDFYLCKPFVTFNGDNNPDFDKKVDEYKAKLAEQKEKETDDDEDGNFISETLSNVSKHKYIVVGIVVAVGVVITVLILRRKRSDK